MDALRLLSYTEQEPISVVEKHLDMEGEISEPLLEDQDLLAKVSSAFISDIQIQISLLNKAIQSRDFKLTEHIFHKIEGAGAKGSALTAKRVDSETEDNAVHQQFENIHEKFLALQEAIHALHLRMDDHSKRTRAGRILFG